MEADYIIKRLSDYSRLNEVYRLYHDSLVNAGYIKPQANGEVMLSPHLDCTPQTTIVIAEKNEQIIGTISITLDSSDGLPSDHYFKEEIDKLRSEFNKSI